MNDQLSVHVLHTLTDLPSVASHLELMQAFAPLEQFAERTTAAQFRENVKILRVFEVVPVGEDVPVLAQGAMNADLSAQLLSCLDLLQVRFADDFGRHHNASLIVADLIHARKAALPNERTESVFSLLTARNLLLYDNA